MGFLDKLLTKEAKKLISNVVDNVVDNVADTINDTINPNQSSYKDVKPSDSNSNQSSYTDKSTVANSNYYDTIQYSVTIAMPFADTLASGML